MVDCVECCEQIEKKQGHDTSEVGGGRDVTENSQKCRLCAVKLSIRRLSPGHGIGSIQMSHHSGMDHLLQDLRQVRKV